MRGRFWCGLYPAALALLPLILGGHARAAENEPEFITLSCDGMFTPTYATNEPAEPQPLQKSSVIVNLGEQTIFFLGYVVAIEDVHRASIRFGGRQIVDYGFTVSISGSIDRVTGRMEATLVMSDPARLPDSTIATIQYDLICKASSN